MKHSELIKLLGEMSLEEKIGQMCQLVPDFLGKTGELTGPLGHFVLNGNETKLLGSVLNANGAENVMKLQDEFMKNHPHNIPLLFMMDVINGYETIFPIPLAQGCSFEPELAKEGAQVASKEAAAEGIAVTFSPMADMVTDARWGRVMETPSEDKLLNYLFAKAMVEGYQGDDLTKKGNIGACIKHFAGYGAPEGGKEYYNCEISERTFMEDYLTGYKGAIDAGVTMAMTSFNSLNRIPSTANEWLMKKVLREQLGFDGVLISDWAAVGELINHTIAQDEAQAAELSVNASVDIDMMTLCYSHNLSKLVEEGRVTVEQIDECTLRILELKNKLGLFENPYKDASVEDEKKLILCDEHRQKARKAATKTMVLLKNDDRILPLDLSKSTAFIGPYADNRQIYGAWSWVDNENAIKTVKEIAGERNIKVSFAKGSTVLGAKNRVKSYTEQMTEQEENKLLEEAIELAKCSEQVVLFVGEYRLQSGEASSRTDIELPKIQQKLIDEVSKVNDNVVLVVFAGRPLVLTDVLPKVKSVLYAWFPGTEGANALMDILTGEQSPSAKLSISFPRCSSQCPVSYRSFSTGRPSDANAEFNYASGYIDCPITPLLPFGYGLTYTDFEISKVTLSGNTMTENDTITATVTVTNTGDREGEQVVQLYVQDVKASVIRPTRELKAFKKLKLSAGESAQVELSVSEEMLRFYTRDMSFKSEKGLFRVYVGFDSTTDNFAEFSLV